MRAPALLSLTAMALIGCSETSIGTFNSLPTVHITSHYENDPVVEAIPFIVRATMGDADNNTEDLEASWYVANDLVPQCTRIAPDENGVSECTVSMYSNSDPPRVSVDVRDPRGGSATAAVTLDVVAQQAGYDAPHAEILAPADASISNEGELLTFHGTVSDVLDSPTDIVVSWASDRDGVINDTSQPDSGGNTQFAYGAGLSPGLHIITLQATDTDGNFTSDFISHIVNGVPNAPVVSIAPDPAPSSQDLLAVIDVDSIDPEGDPVSYTWEWFLNGNPTLNTGALLWAAETSRGDLWEVQITPHDGTSAGPYGSAQVVIENAAPVVSSASITPEPAYTNDLLMVSAVATDADASDTVTLTYDWHVNGLSTGETTPTLDGVAFFSRDDVVQVFVAGSDGSDTGVAVGSNLVTIANSGPTQPVVSIAPTAPLEQVDDLLCSIDTLSTDPDGDPVTYTFEWDIDGLPYVGGAQSVYIDDTAAMSDTWDGETWTCGVVAADNSALVSMVGEDSVTIGVATLNPDYDGLFDIVPDVSYTCAFGLVNITLQQAVFQVTYGGDLWVSGAPPPAMKQSPAPLDENFNVSDVITGSCDETYSLSGSFSDNDNWSGIFSVSFNGAGCGFSGCSPQNWLVDGVRL